MEPRKVLLQLSFAIALLQIAYGAVADSTEGFEGTFPPSGWTTGGNANWFRDSSTKFEGNYSAASGDISDSQYTYLKVTQTYNSDGQIKFYWKVSSESGWDYLYFYIDGVIKTRISGGQSWAQLIYTITKGTHTFEWRYVKDGSVSIGSDSGWVDKVEFIGAGDTTPPVISNGQPTGTIKITNPTLSATTDESATCKYSTASGVSYDSMANTFSTTGGTSHSQPLSGLTDGTKKYYVKCMDSAGNKNTVDYTITFTVDTTPPSTSIASVEGDASSPYYDTKNDGDTNIIVNGESGMSCRWYTSDVAYDYGSGTACTTSGSQATCTVSTTSGSYTRYVACADSLGNGQTSGQNLDISWTVDYTIPSCGVSSISESSVYAYAVSAVILYSTASSGSFIVNVQASDGSGIQKVSFPTTVSAGGDDASSPYSWSYNWGPSSTFSSSAFATCYDNAGNPNSALFAVSRDISPPYNGGISYFNGYYPVTSVAMSLNAGSDSQSGINYTSDYIERQEATLSAGSCGSFSSWTIVQNNPDISWTDTTVAHGKCYKYQYSVRDNVYNLATFTTANIAKIDTTPPTVGQATVSSGTTYTNGSKYWYKGTISISAPASDAESALSCEYTTGSDWLPATYDNINYVCKKDSISPAADIAINTHATGSLQTTGTSRLYVYDNTAPSTTADAVTENNAEPYIFGTVTNQNVVILLVCTDNAGGSGCSIPDTKYCTDASNSCIPATAGNSFTVSAEGTTYVRFQSKDKLGNIEAVQSKTVIIDNTPPTKATVDVPVNTSYYKAATMPATFSGKAKDNIGGGGLNANSATFYLKKSDNTYWTGSQWSAAQAWLTTAHSTTTGDTEITWTRSSALPAWSDGSYYVKAKAVDKMSNTFEGSEISFVYDNTPPTVNIDSPDASKWFNSGITVQYDATDANIASCIISTKDDGGSWKERSAICGSDQTLLITVGNGKYCSTEGKDMCSVKVYASDKAGNSNEIVRNFSIDTTLPTIDLLSHSPEKITPDIDVTISVEASDKAGSNPGELDTIKIYVDNQLKQTCNSSPCLFTSRYSAGKHNYYATAADKAGNEKTSSTQSFTVVVPENIDIKKGWNLISAPYKQFDFISSTCESRRNLYNYDPTTRNWNTIRNVQDMEGGKGYWLYSEKDCIITVLGLEKDKTTSGDIKIVTGWNQIGSTGTDSTFTSVKKGGCSFQTIIYYNAVTENWEVKAESDKIEKFKSYFINAVCP